jgi:putative addiction module killer protein
MGGDVTKKTVRQTRAYRCWFDAVLNRPAKAIVASRVARLQLGLYGDVKPCGEGVSEIRIDVGPGYRIYFSETLDHAILLLLIGGDKSTHKKDIQNAKKMLSEMKQQRESLKSSKGNHHEPR